MTLRGTRSTPTRGSATPISALRKRWYFLALALGAFGTRCHVGLVSAGRPIALLRILGRLLELVPANPPPLPLTLGSGRALRLRVRWALARYRRTPCHDGYALLDEIAASKPAGNTSASPARAPARPCQHAPTGPRARARARGVRAQTNTRPRVRAFLPRPRIRLQADTHAAPCAHAPTHARACTPKHARTRTHQWLSRPWMATTRLTACRGTGTCTPLTWTATSAGNAKAAPSRSCAAPSRLSVLAAAPV